MFLNQTNKSTKRDFQLTPVNTDEMKAFMELFYFSR